MEERVKVKAMVHTPIQRPRPKRGRGFSLEELRAAGLTPLEAKGLGIYVDKRRGTMHPENIGVLKENYGAVIPLITIKGIGAATEKKLIDAGVLDAYDLAQVDLKELAEKTHYSKEKLQKWQEEAKELLKEVRKA
jgi:hypothetical protein